MMTGIYQDSYIYAYLKPYYSGSYSGDRNRYRFDPLVVKNISDIPVSVVLVHNDELRDAGEDCLRNYIREESFDLYPGSEYICNNYIGHRSDERETHYLTTAYRIIQVKPLINSESSAPYYNPKPKPKPKPKSQPEREAPAMKLPSSKRFLGYIILKDKEIPVSFNLDFKTRTGSTKYSNGPLPLTISDIEYYPNFVKFVLTETHPDKKYIPNNYLGGNTTAVYACQLYSDGTLEGHGTNSKGKIFNFELH